MEAAATTDQAPVGGAKKKHISASQVNLYANCGEAWRRRYVEKEIIPPGVAALRGISVHKGAEHNFAQKVTSHVDLPKSQMVDRAVAEFEAKVRAEGVFLDTEAEARGKDIVLGEAKDEAVRLTGLMAETVAPVYQPVAVEEKQTIILPDSPRDLLGILDMAGHLVADPTGAVGIVDYKSGKRTKPQSDFDNSVALSIYGLTYRAKNGKPPAFIHVEQLVDTKVPKHQRNVVVKTRRDYEVTVARVNATIKGVEAGVFTPAAAGSWMCSTKWCGYARTCPYFNAERQAAAGE